MTKPPEPVVTGELKPCPFCGTANLRIIEVAPVVSNYRRVSHDPGKAGFGCFVSGPIRVGEAEAVAAWNTRTANALPGDVGMQSASFVRDDQCNVEFGTVPDCDCPHEHWHVGGVCLDVHIEEDGSGHAILDNSVGDWELRVSGVADLDEMRAIAFAWTSQKFALTPSALSGDAGEIETLKAALADPNAVHVNMLRGGIARPSLAQIIHIYGEEAIRAALPSHQGAE